MADFARLALAPPGVPQYLHFDRIAFNARVTFATLAPDRLSANLKFTPGAQAHAAAAGKPRRRVR